MEAVTPLGYLICITQLSQGYEHSGVTSAGIGLRLPSGPDSVVSSAPTSERKASGFFFGGGEEI